MKTLIIGKSSNLSIRLMNFIEDAELLSTRDICNEEIPWKSYQGKELNIIFNNFQKATMLNDLTSPVNYIKYSILATSIVLENLAKHQNINKIIYTSSSSVYGNNIFCKESDDIKPINLHASLKASNERLIEQFCKLNNIDYTITRVFNMYGGDDEFSIVSKIINSYINNEVLNIANHGSAIRDFIHIDDVVKIYRDILTIKNLPILNIGSGEGVSIKNIIDYLKLNNINIKTTNISRSEIKMSTADNDLLLKSIKTNNFTKVEDYILKVIQQKSKDF
ncbi:MAG: NAD(P)-dependent oxidoreductase [Sulfurimonas sp.]|uniref:NAD-dependent epimerase/dehydratase family protein n=1 Tax=Sulfurimonas sp. TaxID=2022749 RepID=UPI0025F6C580|nr:NAD(P)-dependent oxidoreductase [Sulfurimonas sp.]MCK9455057.1 NAD(P)-dependent oxidoreductase [Sulfurimonas sp.]